jgi:hypothetical protein
VRREGRAISALPSAGAAPLSPQDRAAIADLQARYGFALDLRAFDDLRAVFTEDAEIDYSMSTQCHTGLDRIVAFFRSTATRVGATQHLMHTSLVWATGPDTVEGRTHVTAHHTARGVAPPVPAASTYTVTGTYTDRYVRTATGWRIRYRRNTLLTCAGDPAILAPS